MISFFSLTSKHLSNDVQAFEIFLSVFRGTVTKCKISWIILGNNMPTTSTHNFLKKNGSHIFFYVVHVN
jgi:hypothetical protein